MKSLFFIAYDIKEKNSANYEDLEKALEDSGAKKVQKSVWALRSDKSTSELCDKFQKYINKDDRLLVIEKSSWSSWNSETPIRSI